jgi:hypothetical protein
MQYMIKIKGKYSQERTKVKVIKNVRKGFEDAFK